ncbi:MAG: pentapeptide repeat-containing protein [Gammaproteobacteria bacterium]
MGRDLPGGTGTDARFWDGFLEVVRAQGVRAPFDRWYVIRAEQYLKTYPEMPLSRHRPEEVGAYLEEIGRKGSLKDWQFRQVVDSLEALFCKLVVAPWAGQFDWGYWKDSSRSLEPDHATIARDGPLPRASGRHDRQEPAEGLGAVRGNHGEVLYALIANLSGADLREADLRDAELEAAELRWTKLSEANLQGANLRGVKGLTRRSCSLTEGLWLFLKCPFLDPEDELRKAKNWGLAYYSKDLLGVLGLPSDHNERIGRKS